MKDASLYLKDMLDHLEKIERFTKDGREAFMRDDKTQLAVIRAYEVVGEITKRLPASLREAHPQIDWKRLMGFRDFLAHNYEEIILDFVWNAVEDLPKLRAAVAALLASRPEDSAE